jgi:sensor histidine kinase YesM
VLESSKNELITLDEELQIIKKYVQVENSRFDHDIDLRIQKMDKRILQMKFPPLILQSIVENAIWHGLVPLDKEMEKKIEVHYDDNSVQLIIEDNGIGLDKARQNRQKKSRKSNSLGIDNIKERLIYF